MRPKVSIIIVNLNRAALTLNCVKAIIEHTERGLCEIIVVDNGSAAAEVEMLAAGSHQLQLVRLDRNMFFGEASNIGAEQGSGDYVLFLNNDVTVTAGWLDALLATLKTEYRAGAVGPKIVYPGGELQEAGCVVRPDGWGVQIGKAGTQLPRSFIDATRIVDYCSGACLLMRRQTFLDLGGFDPIFDPAYFEDVDLALRLRSIGLFTYYCGAATVHHEESATSNRIWSTEERRGHVTANHGRLVLRWGGYLRERITRDVAPEPLAALTWEPERTSAGKQVVAVYFPKSPRADSCSHSLLWIAAAFQDVCEVIIAADEVCSRCRVYSLCRHFDVGLTSFKVRRVRDIDQSECSLIVSLGARDSRHFAARSLDVERHGRELLGILNGLTNSADGAAG